jgi:Ala-tRNA(Pro) deacylase
MDKEAAMTISKRLTDFLDAAGVEYRTRAHEHSRTSAQTARTAHVLPQHLAKGVLLEDEAGYLMAVVPADRQLNIGTLARMFDRHSLHLVDERRIGHIFHDCETGAMPPVGMAWGIDTVVDDTLEASDVVYLEAGDHETLLQLSHQDFHRLMRDTPHGRICRRMLH